VSNLASIDACLPQTQCTTCGYADCRAYAEAIAEGQAAIDRCAPGGETTLRALADVVGTSVPDKLAEDLKPFAGFLVARIREHECIGCTKCIPACPVDAIVGSGKMMHSVIESACTGCELCIAPCPVDCIDLVDPPFAFTSSRDWPQFPEDAPARFRAARERRRARTGSRPKKSRDLAPTTATSDPADLQREILDAVARSRGRRRTLGG
jgi:Na+-translocating ferredoxin:NAD+ oxidoreductase subunit B